MTTVLRALPLLALIAAGSGAVAAPSGADVSVTPPAGGGFVVKNNAGNATRLRVTEGGEVYLPNLPNTSEAGNVACYDSSGRLARCAPSALPGGGLPWARSHATAPNGIAVPILVVNTAVPPGVSVTTSHAGNYVAHWTVSVQLPLALVGITCGVHVNGTLVPGSQTLETFNQSVLAPRAIHGTALLTNVQAGDNITPQCASNLLGTIFVAARIVVQEVGDAQANTIP
ncbi:MAG TPA: hypothetical protein VMS38_26990 [Pseudorhodoferax sp.]|nr:hypothetical protein [Pseudorhodoferax sp.]